MHCNCLRFIREVFTAYAFPPRFVEALFCTLARALRSSEWQFGLLHVRLIMIECASSTNLFVSLKRDLEAKFANLGGVLDLDGSCK